MRHISRKREYEVFLAKNIRPEAVCRYASSQVEKSEKRKPEALPRVSFFGSPCWETRMKTIEYCFRRSFLHKARSLGKQFVIAPQTTMRLERLRSRNQRLRKQSRLERRPQASQKKKIQAFRLGFLAPPAGLEPATP